jgi:hypothetical protein
MTIDELMPTLRELTRAEKLRAIQFLASELEKEDVVWSLRESHAATSQLQQLLDEHQKSQNE